MPYRSRLTSPPDVAAEPVSDSAGDDVDYYSPGFDLPREPRIWSRAQRRAVAAVVALVIALAAIGLFRIATAGQAEDPAMEQRNAVADA